MVEFSLFHFFLFYFIFEHFQSTQKHVVKVFRKDCKNGWIDCQESEFNPTDATGWPRRILQAGKVYDAECFMIRAEEIAKRTL